MADLLEDDPSSGLQSSEEEEEEEMQVESLVQGRAKRSTAGRNMSALIDAAADDDLTLLFEEVEDDNEFAVDAEAAEEEDMGLESSSDDDDDQGPNSQNDYEGEKELQKEERKKRRAQNDLRFQTLRKRVKIDPTAVSSVPAPPPRPKKKSERISWLPTVEDGPTRSSSRRQTMVNKELTHARLKDSQEKRIRIIATMKEAEKRKAHLKPKQMTQEDHLAEAARVERTNSKSLNRWELSEKKKAEERKAKIEALQNRRLEGPVLSYWSGVATWVNGRLTKVGKVEIKAKPEKEEPRKKKKDKDEKNATESQGAQSATPAPVPPSNITAPSTDASVSASTTAPAEPGTVTLAEGKTLRETPVPTTSAPGNAVAPTSTQEQPSMPDESSSEQPATAKPPLETNENNETPPTAESMDAKKEDPKVAEPPSQAEPVKSSEKQPEPTESITGGPSSSSDEQVSIDKPAEASSIEKPGAKSEDKPDAMDIDSDSGAEPIKVESQPPIEQTPSAAGAPAETSTSTDAKPTSGEVPQTTLASSTTAPVTEHLSPVAAAPAPTPADPQAPQAQAPPSDAAPLQATPPNIPGALNQGVDQPPQQQGSQGDLLQQSTQSQESIPAVAQPEIPPAPPVIEYTGRNLTILENFDDRTAHSKKFSMYFNAKKPPRLTSTCPVLFIKINIIS
jgi:vacuolar protein sorting-associated protein 72